MTTVEAWLFHVVTRWQMLVLVEHEDAIWVHQGAEILHRTFAPKKCNQIRRSGSVQNS